METITISKPESKKMNSASAAAVPVTADNFNRAESDMYFSAVALKEGGFGKFSHRREVYDVDHQTVVRGNRDTLYSSSVFDMDAGAVTITLPDTEKRFMSMEVIDEDQYIIETVYAPGTFTYTREKAGTRYIIVGIRTFIDPGNQKDVEQVHALQDAIEARQPGAGTFDIPNWDQFTQKKVRDALIILAETLPDTYGMFGGKNKVDPVRHLIGTATGWGGNAPEDALYLMVVPPGNDGKIIHTLTIKDEVPVDGFWSVSVYNKEGYFQKNDKDSYSVNNVTSKKNPDGSITIQFGGCDGKQTNCIPITPGWNYWVRLYRPRKEILNGTWKFPDAQPIS